LREDTMSEEREAEEIDSPEPRIVAAAPDPSGTVLETNRLVLRPPHTDDAADLARLADNPRIARNLMSLPFPYRVEHALGWIGSPLGARAQRRLICRKALDGAPAPVGVVTLETSPGSVLPRLGCWLGEAFWGQGLATEACHAVVDYAFLHQDHDKLAFCCRVTNAAGRRLIEKCGFQMVAQELDRSLYQGTAVAVDRFQIDRRCWQSLRGWEPLRLHQRSGTGLAAHRLAAACATR
jgi:RimJ/RimL family protein N-acetyltransferase